MVNINDTKEEVIMHSIRVVKEKLFPLLKERLNCEGLTLAQNNELGQEIKHYHIHLIPRYPEDHADFIYDKDKVDDLDEVFNKLK
jgi:histidine triad (HIT) family protein